MAKMSVEEFFGKLEWEGGYPDLALYGLEPKDIANKQLATLWQQYREKHAELELISDKIEKMRPEE